MSTAKRIKVAHEAGEEDASPRSDKIKHIQDLPNDVFRHCLEFVGKGNFVFVAPVSKHFYWNYINLGVEMKNNVIDVDVILQQGKNKKTTAKAVAAATGLRLATECFLKAPKGFQEELCRQATVGGRLDILKCAVAICGDMETAFPYRNTEDSHYDYSDEDVERTGDVLVDTLANGHLDVIEYLHDQGIDLERLLEYLEEDSPNPFRRMRDKCKATSLHWLVSKGIISDWAKEDIVHDLARDGEIDILKESYKKFITNDSLCACAEAGNLQALNRLLHESDFDYGWTFDVFSKAAKGGNIPIMELCLRSGCPTGARLYGSAMENKNKEAALGALKWLREKNIPWNGLVCRNAAMYGNLKALKWARENGCPWDRETFNCAAKYGHIDILDYCFQHNCPIDSSRIYKMPFDDGNSNPTFSELQDRSLKVYKWLHQHSIPWNEDVSVIAARKRHLTTLRWAIENGCPWREGIFEEAAKSWDITMVKYCLQHLAPTDVDIYVYTINKISETLWSSAIIEVFLMFHDYGIPWNREIIPCAERHGKSEVANWLRYVGCPE